MHICVDMLMYVWMCVGLGVQALGYMVLLQPSSAEFVLLGSGGEGLWFKGFVALGLTWPCLIKFK